MNSEGPAMDVQLNCLLTVTMLLNIVDKTVKTLMCGVTCQS